MKLLWLEWWTWKDTLAVAGGATILLVFLEKMKKAGVAVYKGAPLLWKWIMRTAIYRQEMENRHKVLYDMVHEISNQIAAIKSQVEYNGGSSMKDATKRIELLITQQAELNRVMDTRMEISELANNRMTFRLDNEGACIEINEVFLKRFGYNEKDILGFGFESVVHEEDLLEMRSKWTRAIEQCNRFYDEQRIMNCHTKTHELCTVRGFPICDGDILKGFVGFIETIQVNN